MRKENSVVITTSLRTTNSALSKIKVHMVCANDK